MNTPLDLHLAHAGPRSVAQPTWTESDGALPALYIGHGAPPLLVDQPWMTELFEWMQRFPKPRAILMVSAHWETAPPMISSTAANTPLVYDFGGFPEYFYQLQYPTPDASDLGTLVTSLFPDSAPLEEFSARGLDHGAWVPLLAMYPNGDVPVIQLSIPTHDPATLLALGERLRPLREHGVLIVGSGFLTHGLPYMTRANWAGDHTPAGWSRDFDEWAKDALARGDLETLAAVDTAPGMPYAHPTLEHYVPLFITLGAATDPSAPSEQVIDGYFMGLAKRSFQVA